MDFIKKNIMLVASGAVAVLAVVALFLGISKMGGVRDLLSPAEQQAGAVQGILSGVSVTDPKDNSTRSLIPTEKVLAELKDVQRALKQQGNSILGVALQKNIGYDPVKKTLRRQPLVDGIFPKPASLSQPYEFPKAYRKAIDQLLVRMQAGTVPTQQEIEEAKELEIQKMGLAAGPAENASRTGRRASKTVVTVDNSEVDIAAKALISAADRQARKIKVYCDSIRNLDVMGEAYSPSSGKPPQSEDLWWAQLSYWLQDDIVNAICQANAEARDVYESPVKRVIKIQLMHGYLVANGEKLEFVGVDDLAGAPPCFTNLGADKAYDILRFEVDLLVDARKIPTFIDAMYKQGHYLMYMWNIQDARLGRGASGASGQDPMYRYGDGVPVVKLTTYWETYLLRDFYHWGIVGYESDNATKKSYVRLYDGSRKALDDNDLEKRAGLLPGLMPKAIRQAIGSEPADSPEAPK